MSVFIRYQKLSKNAHVPTRGTAHSAGLDLYSSVDTVVPAKAWNNFISVGAGVIDPDYKGPLRVLLFNFGESDHIVSRGDRIAQLIIQPRTYILLIQPEFDSPPQDKTYNSESAKKIAKIEESDSEGQPGTISKESIPSTSTAETVSEDKELGSTDEKNDQKGDIDTNDHIAVLNFMDSA
ncbi:deoxyuridine 5'-triphosphate nucleotidohydrolase-like [Panonychus citri]|uniref:deoxyuridine 5'-triphosphate nucleotidohydrolase-like n=1 Tax=Panonychus citri TaxID=50023 RepID=UPI002307093C|nr:deoxyuridine 5'-triphosphate nucleotidohydrolase-like [Panonychus citri]